MTSIDGEMSATEADRIFESKRIFNVAWVLTIAFVALLIGFSTFYGVSRLEKNTAAVAKTCEARNEQIATVNHKFQQFIALINASSQERQPLTPEVAKLYAEFSAPIPPVSCGVLKS